MKFRWPPVVISSTLISMPGLSEILVVAATGVVLFNYRRLHDLFGLMGKSIRSFKEGLRDAEPPARDVHEYRED